MKRLGILCVDDETGSEFRYLAYLLSALGSTIDSFVVVMCGQPSVELDELVRAYAHQVLRCKRACGLLGFYEAGFEAACSGGMLDVDEVVFLSHRLFGPLSDVQKMFDEMDCRADLDVWSITSFQTDGQSYLEPYFFVARRKAFSVDAFKKALSCGAESHVAGSFSALCARAFTHALEAEGLTWGTFVSSEVDELVTGRSADDCPSVINPYDLVVNRGMPFIRHESFGLPRSAYLRYGTQDALLSLLEYLETHGIYDVSLMTSHMIPRVGWRKARASLGQVVISPGTKAAPQFGEVVALVRVENSSACMVLTEIPSQVDLIVVSDTLDEKAVDALHKGANTLLRANERSGFEVFFESGHAQDWLRAHRYLCYVEPERCFSAPYPTAQRDSLRYLLDNLVDDDAYVAGVVTYFDHHPWVGAVSSPLPSFSACFGDLLSKDSENAPSLSAVLEELGFEAHADDVCPAPSWGFWCKTDLLSLYADASALAKQSIAYTLPYVAQAHGLVAGTVISPKHCDAEFANDAYMVSTMSAELAKAASVHVPTFETFVATTSGHTAPEVSPRNRSRSIGLSALHKAVKKLSGAGSAVTQKSVQDKLASFVAHPHYNEGMEGEWKKNKQLAVALSPVRKNVVRWIPFKKSDVVVEIGGSYGELTTYIAPRVAQLYVCERDGMRQSIIHDRCRSMDNVQVIEKPLCIASLKGLEAVDWMIVHNIDGMFDDEREFKSFLRAALDVARPRRVAVFGANRQGVRFPMESRYIEGGGTESTSKVSLHRAELSQLLGASGLSDMQFFYPYPDHVFCKTLYSDEHLPDAPDLLEGVWRLSGQRLQDGDERLELSNAAADKRYPDRANSLMVVASRQCDLLGAQLPTCVRFPSDRKERFSLQTSFLPRGVVRKECITTSARGHLATARRYTDTLREMYARGGMVLDDITYHEDWLEYVFVPGKSLHTHCVALINSGRTDHFLKECKTFIERLELAHDEGFFTASWQFQEVFGTPVLPPRLRCSLVSNIDMNLDNFIMGDDGQIHLIDCEWIFNFPIPCLYIIWRAVFYFFEKMNCNDAELVDGLRSRCYEMAGISDELVLTFRQMERHFQRYMGV